MISEKYLDEFISDFCLKTDITLEQLKSKTRVREVVEKRMIIAYFLRNSYFYYSILARFSYFNC